MAGATWETARKGHFFRLQDYHLLWSDFPDRSTRNDLFDFLPVRNPAGRSHYPGRTTLAGYHVRPVWARFHFARRYSGSRNFFTFLEVLRCFTSLRDRPHPIYSDEDIVHSDNGFPHSEISGSTVAWHLPEAYRSLQRPSSTSDAKTSTIHP